MDEELKKKNGILNTELCYGYPLLISWLSVNNFGSAESLKFPSFNIMSTWPDVITKYYQEGKVPPSPGRAWINTVLVPTQSQIIAETAGMPSLHNVTWPDQKPPRILKFMYTVLNKFTYPQRLSRLAAEPATFRLRLERRRRSKFRPRQMSRVKLFYDLNTFPRSHYVQISPAYSLYLLFSHLT